MTDVICPTSVSRWTGVVLDTELKIGVGCDYNALYST